MKIEVEIWVKFQLMKGSSSNPGEDSKQTPAKENCSHHEGSFSGLKKKKMEIK